VWRRQREIAARTIVFCRGHDNNRLNDGKLLTTYTSLVAAQPYGWFQYGNSVFIGIDTEETPGRKHKPSGCFNGYVSPTQLELVKAKIASLPSGTNVFLFMHRPTQDDNDHKMAADPADQKTAYAKQLIAFVDWVNSLPNSNVVCIFASHDHRYYAPPIVAATARVVISGGGGAPLSGCPNKARAGVLPLSPGDGERRHRHRNGHAAPEHHTLRARRSGVRGWCRIGHKRIPDLQQRHVRNIRLLHLERAARISA
jgi:hypothetical protein